MAAILVQPTGRTLRGAGYAKPEVQEDTLAVVIPFPGVHQPFDEVAPAPHKPRELQKRAISQVRVRNAAAAQQGRMRLTTRGWVVVSVLSVIAAIVGGAIMGMALEPELFESAATATMTVQQGDTLWAIASHVALPEHDVRDVIEVIKDLNGLSGSALNAGQQLVIPVTTP